MVTRRISRNPHLVLRTHRAARYVYIKLRYTYMCLVTRGCRSPRWARVSATFWYTHSYDRAHTERCSRTVCDRYRALLLQLYRATPLRPSPGIFDIATSALDAVAATKREMLAFSFGIERPSIIRAASVAWLALAKEEAIAFNPAWSPWIAFDTTPLWTYRILAD